MKISLPLVAAVLVLLMVATVQGIRLDEQSHSAFSNQIANNGEKGVVKTDGEPVGEMEETISEEKNRAVGHRLPEIHVDYYGPRGHNPRHH